MSDAGRAGRRAGGRALAAGLAGMQGWLAASIAYLLALLSAGARSGTARDAPRPDPPLRLAVLIPAHDEEAGVADAVHALIAQEYPGDRLAVIVIADNCTDDTAGEAARAGATVWSREDLTARGKGPALSWALERLQRDLPAPDAVIVVDADCIASANLCAAVAAELSDPGVQAVQGRYDVSNPDASPTAALRAAGFILRHVIRARGRARLGLSCGLFGSGMAFRMSVFDVVRWPASVTEDTELHLMLVQHGIVVRFAERAGVRSPMPTTATAAVEQQMRWESGNAHLTGAYLMRLVTRGLATGDAQLLAAGGELLVPSQSMIAAGSLGLGAVSAALGRRRTAVLAAATLFGQAVYVIGGLTAAGAPTASLRALAHAPAFVAARLSVLGRVASGRRAQTWVRTTRERQS
ncbi:MAG TPA: glycosyltransferase family 2 protein [Solirubrobacteraceae bacterium]|nr:glycosyltransferase family 2 protein [Solirubrobacteraceae bacterium]